MRTFFFTPSMQGNNLFAFILLIWCLNRRSVGDAGKAVPAFKAR